MPPRITQEVVVHQTWEPGHVFELIGVVYLALRQEGFYHEAQTFKRTAYRCRNYDEVFQLALATVTLTPYQEGL